MYATRCFHITLRAFQYINLFSYYVDVESEPAVCQCDYRSRGLYVCEHILAVLCSRTDGEIVLHRMANYEQAQEAKVHDPLSS